MMFKDKCIIPIDVNFLIPDLTLVLPNVVRNKGRPKKNRIKSANEKKSIRYRGIGGGSIIPFEDSENVLYSHIIENEIEPVVKNEIEDYVVKNELEDYVAKNEIEDYVAKNEIEDCAIDKEIEINDENDVIYLHHNKVFSIS
jgi:hypothetical protein